MLKRTQVTADETVLRLEPGALPNMINSIESGAISRLIAATYVLRQIEDAQTAFQAKKHMVKIVLTVAHES